MLIGEMVGSIRKNMGVSQQKLCKGLCTVSALSKYESGERIPDTLLFSALMQRMGKTADNFAFMISDEEYRYYTWKKQTQECIRGQEWGRLETLLSEYRSMNFCCNQNLQEQYRLYLEAVLQETYYGKIENMIELLLQAIWLTVPDFKTKKWNEDALVSLSEMNLIMLYLDKAVQNGKILREYAGNLLAEMLRYTEKICWDEQEAVKVFPRLVCMFIRISDTDITAVSKIYWCRKALEMLTRMGFLYDLPEILLLLEQSLTEQGKKEAIIFRRQREALCEVLLEYGGNPDFQMTELYDNSHNLFLVSEMLHNYRVLNGLTQENASEGICAVETYSRLETGKQKPSAKHYRALESKLGIGWGYYRRDLEIEDYCLMEKRNDLQQAVYHEQWDKALNLLESLK